MDGKSFSLIAKIFEKNLDFSHKEIIIFEKETTKQPLIKLEISSSKKIIFLWESKNDKLRNLKFKIFNEEGTKNIFRESIIPNTITNFRMPAIALNSSDDIIICFENSLNFKFSKISCKEFDIKGKTSSEIYSINKNDNFSQNFPSIKFFSEDRFLLATIQKDEKEPNKKKININIYSKNSKKKQEIS